MRDFSWLALQRRLGQTFLHVWHPESENCSSVAELQSRKVAGLATFEISSQIALVSANGSIRP